MILLSFHTNYEEWEKYSKKEICFLRLTLTINNIF